MQVFLMLRQRRPAIERASTVLNAAEVRHELIAAVNSAVFCALVKHRALLVPKRAPTAWVWTCKQFFLLTTTAILPRLVNFFLGILKSTPVRLID